MLSNRVALRYVIKRNGVIKLITNYYYTKKSANSLKTLFQMVLRILQQNPDDSVKSKAAFALSCLVRRFPLAQHDFVQRGGVPIISKLFDLPETKLQIKLTTLISDMLSEYEEAKKDTKNPDYVSKLQQYGLVNLSSRLESLNWCQNLNNLLFSVVIVDRYDHDAIEKVIVL